MPLNYFCRKCKQYGLFIIVLCLTVSGRKPGCFSHEEWWINVPIRILFLVYLVNLGNFFISSQTPN